MKCPKCNETLLIQVGIKVNAQKCKILTELTSILTVQCDKCKHVFQLPVQGKRAFSANKDN